jgi:hypothetical protein
VFGDDLSSVFARKNIVHVRGDPMQFWGGNVSMHVAVRSSFFYKNWDFFSHLLKVTTI